MRTLLFGVLLLAAAVPALPAPGATEVRLDFGDAREGGGVSQVEKGYLRVTASTAYTAALGHGWRRASGLQNRDRTVPDALRSDFVYGASKEPSEFAIDLPAGAYRVTVVTGDVEAGDHVLSVDAERRRVLDDVHPEAREFITATFGVRVEDGQLNLLFMSPTGNWVLNALRVEPAADAAAAEPARIRRERVAARDPASAERRRRLMVPSPDVRPLHLLKPAPFDHPGYPGRRDYLRILERFPLYAERGWHPNYQGLPDVGYFGDEDHAEMGLRATGNFIFTYALLATDPGYDPRPSGVSRETLLDRCRQCLRYMIRAHVTGDLTCADGRKWGNHWQSSWWVSRMAAGAYLLWNVLSAEERAAVCRVVAFEADRQGRRTPPGGVARDTKSEENAWDTESLAWALALMPTHENAPRWDTKLREFAANTLSTPADASSTSLLDGKPVREWVKTANVHDDFTIENHGAYHFCYMSCPLHNLAWSYHALRSARRAIPPQLRHHYRDVWDVAARTFLPDGRFAYVSGKDWPRYAYGLSFILPVLVLMQVEQRAETEGRPYEPGVEQRAATEGRPYQPGVEHRSAQARLFERLRVACLEREQMLHGDGTLFGGRFTRNVMADRLAEYETDAYALLGLSYLLHYREEQSVAPLPLERYLDDASGAWSSPDSGFLVARAGDLFTSFSWRTLSGRHVQGLFIPGDASLAEWGPDQLAGALEIEGCDMKRRPVTHNDRVFKEGFITVGRIDEGGRDSAAGAAHYLAFASLPRERVAVVIERVVASAAVTVTRNEALRFYLPNDLFNGNRRLLRWQGGRRSIIGVEPERRGVKEHRLPGPWLNVDGRLGFAQVGVERPFVVRDAAARNAPWGSLLTEGVVVPVTEGRRRFAAGETIREAVFALVAGGPEATARAARAEVVSMPALGSDVVCVRLQSPGGGRWLVAANFGESVAEASVPVGGAIAAPLRLEPLSGDCRPLGQGR